MGFTLIQLLIVGILLVLVLVALIPMAIYFAEKSRQREYERLKAERLKSSK